MLKIDLLPKHFAIARQNKRILVGAVILLVVVLLGFSLKSKAIQADMVRTEEAIAEVKPTADQVRELEGEVSEKQTWLDPIRGKIDFIAKADETGEKFFDRFHSINEYIWQEARMSSFSISGSSIQFTVGVRGTAGVGRFLLNLLRCPDLTNITYSGVPGGQSIEASGAAAAGAVPGMAGPGTMGPGGMPPGRLGSGMMGPGMTRPDMMGPGMMGPGMMGPGGMPGPAGAPGVASVEPGSPNEPITLQISATLTEPITIPTPPGATVAGAGMGAGMGPGMMGPGMMRPGGMPAGRPGGPGRTEELGASGAAGPGAEGAAQEEPELE